MTEVAHAPADDEQLPLEFEQPEAGTVREAAPADAMDDIVRSPAYVRLAELRDAAYANRRSGARAIAREALAALLAGDITKEEHVSLFTADTGHVSTQVQPGSESDGYSTERPPREPDHAERAAGEAVRHPWDDD